MERENRINKKRVYKLIIIFGAVLLTIGIFLIPFNIYYWNHEVGCSSFPLIPNGVRQSYSCWGSDTANMLDSIRNILIVSGLAVLLGLPFSRWIQKYIYTQDK